MRRLGIGLAAALMVAAFATGAAAQKKGKAAEGEITAAAKASGMAEAPPLTRLEVGAQEEAAIRRAVREADPSGLGVGRVVARAEHAAGLAALFADLSLIHI